ncbi:GhoT/OrtT family toxin [Citrobacter sp. wls826]|uniref:GhoT/OrtT family toxin n=1 Tax=Citrobacter sp. wls826 TaxID=2576415 RepID=UPI00207B2BD5|nr:GhoT/OrtT family toxin [Citrobacter sp. wls826]
MYLYITGFAISAVVTYILSSDSDLKINVLASILIGLSWPLSFPVALLFVAF